MIDFVKKYVQFIVGVGLIVGALLGIEDYTLSPVVSNIVTAIVMFLLWLFPKPSQKLGILADEGENVIGKLLLVALVVFGFYAIVLYFQGNLPLP